MAASSTKTTRTRKSTTKTSSKNGASSNGGAAKKDVLESFNPATGELVGTVDTITPGKVQGIVDEVAEVQPFWAQLSLDDRARYMRRAGDVLLDEIDDARRSAHAREQGKPRVEAYTMELLPTVDALQVDRRRGPGHPLRRARPDAPGIPEDEALEVPLRAARRGRRDRPLELPVDRSPSARSRSR